jgi:Concanavalin A-like lectin/glucanases superfamily/Immunoglobulin domain
MKNKIAVLLLLCCGLGAPIARAGLHDGLVSYWPLDALTVDPNTGQNMAVDLGPNTNNLLDGLTMTGADIVPGVRGNAASFDGVGKYLYRAYAAGEDNGLPIYNARYYTISMWVRDRKYVVGTNQQTRAVFAEGNNALTQPLFRLTTDTATTGRTNLLAAMIRNDNNNTFFGNTGISFGDSGKSTLMPFDGSWHHVAWVDSNGTARVYVDGQLDPRIFTKIRLSEPQDITARGLTLNTFSLGAALQTLVAGSFFNGLIDEVALWERTLSQDEINEVRTNGITIPILAAAPSVANPPEGSTNLLVGEFFSLQALAQGTHPRTYRWYKDGSPLQDIILTNDVGEITNIVLIGATSNILTLSNLQTTDSGAYTFVVSNSVNSATSGPASLLVSTVSPQAPNLTNGQISYWPMDAIQGITTPDMVRGYDMYLVNMASSNLVAGKWGNAMQFNQNGCLDHIFGANDALPLTKYPEFSISLWINAPATNPGAAGMRFFAQGNSSSTTPYFSLANPDNTGQGPLTRLRGFFRNDNNQNNAVAGTGISALDVFYDPAVTNSTWHHVAYVQKSVGGANPVLQGTFYVDGVQDVMVGAFSPRVPLTAQIMSIGGAVRNTADPLSGGTRGNFLLGLVDDVAVWNRALTAQEIVMLSTNVAPAAPAVLQPIAINSFRADFPEVVNGDSAMLRWSVSGPVAAIDIDQGVGSVFSRTTNGIGSIVVSNLTTSKTFTLTAQRGTNVLTIQTSVAVVNGVAAGWSILDDFQTYSVGPLVNPYWADLKGGSSIEDVGGNHMLNTPAGGGAEGQLAQLQLAGYSINQGQTRTIFARVYVQDDPAATTMLNDIGVTDKTLRTHNDFGTDTGPIVRLNDDAAGDLAVGAYNGVGGSLILTPRKLELQQVYNLWIDVTNGVFTDTDTGDSFSVWVQRVGSNSRIQVVSNYVTDRDLMADFLGPTGLNLDKLVVGNGAAAGTVYVDDLFISKSGYNSTVPVPWAGTTPPALAVPTFTPTIIPATEFTPMQIQFDWSAGALMSAPSMTGPWTVVPDSFGLTYTWTIDLVDPQRFFLILR